MLRTTLLGLLALSALAPLTPAGAQSAPVPVAAAVTREDSARLVRAARADQASFERFRRNRLPQTWGGGSSRCDERIGRFCLTHGRGGGSDWVAPPEDPEVTSARERLVDGLGQVAALIPGDDWIAGQRVRYLVEARRMGEALAAARECGGEGWWCQALLGFVHHYSSRPEAADSAFAGSLAAMDEDERGRWNDLSMILDERSIRIYRRMRPEERAVFEERFWRLSDPLLTREGNEIRSEHFARHVWDQFQLRAQSAEGISWGYDLREILIRYGWPSGWERTRDFGTSAGPPPLISHYSSAPYYLLPPAETLLKEEERAGRWESEDPRSRTGYTIPLADSVARWISPFDHQVAIFRREDQVLVVAGYALPADSVAEGAQTRAGLAALGLLENPAPAEIVVEQITGRTGVLALSTPVRPVLLSLEVLVPEERRIARARYGVDLHPLVPGLLAFSDLLLLESTGELPDSLPQALEQVRGSQQVRAEEEIGIYWEVYGLVPERDAEVTFSLRLLESRTGWLRRLAERAGLLREVNPVRLRWQEQVPAGPYLGRSLSIQIPSVPAGSYTLELAIEAPGREPLQVRRDLEVLPY